jgi:hypothetical protein
MSKKKSHSYYASKVVMTERARDLEENKVIKLLWYILNKYYTHKWERWYD